MDDPVDIDKALVPADPRGRARQERTVLRGFWRKVRRIAGQVPFMEDAVAAYYCAMDPATPAHVKAVLIAALAYFIVPTDLIPDFIAGLGFTDDASVLFTAFTVVGSHVRDRHREHARKVLERPEAEPGRNTASPA